MRISAHMAVEYIVTESPTVIRKMKILHKKSQIFDYFLIILILNTNLYYELLKVKEIVGTNEESRAERRRFRVGARFA